MFLFSGDPCNAFLEASETQTKFCEDSNIVYIIILYNYIKEKKRQIKMQHYCYMMQKEDRNISRNINHLISCGNPIRAYYV